MISLGSQTVKGQCEEISSGELNREITAFTGKAAYHRHVGCQGISTFSRLLCVSSFIVCDCL